MEERIMPWDPLNAWPAGRHWVWMTLAILVAISFGPVFVTSLRPAPDVVVDFFRNWAAARSVRDGLPIYMSQDVVVQRYLGRPRDANDVTQAEVYTHPPATVLLALPLAGLDYPNATLVWNLISLLALLASLELVRRGLGIALSIAAVFPALSLMLLCTPLFEQLQQGQLNLILLLLIVGSWSAERSGRPRLAGACLGTATALKLFPGFLILYFVWK